MPANSDVPEDNQQRVGELIDAIADRLPEEARQFFRAFAQHGGGISGAAFDEPDMRAMMQELVTLLNAPRERQAPLCRSIACGSGTPRDA